jgi:hypothetical protein
MSMMDDLTVTGLHGGGGGGGDAGGDGGEMLLEIVMAVRWCLGQSKRNPIHKRSRRQTLNQARDGN